MKAYQNSLIPLDSLITLAEQSRSIEEAWVQRALVALSFKYEPVLAQAVLMRSLPEVAIRRINRFWFDTPREDEFI